MKKTIALLVVGILSLSGCGTIRQKIYEAKYDRIVAERDQLVKSTRELDPIRNKVWMGQFKDEPPPSMLTISEKPTDTEKDAIAKWHKIVGNFKSKLVSFAGESSEAYSARVEVLYANRLALILELYNQHISYGDYNRKTRELFVKDQQEMLDREQRESLIRQTNPKTSFTCQRIGNMTHCN